MSLTETQATFLTTFLGVRWPPEGAPAGDQDGVALSEYAGTIGSDIAGLSAASDAERARLQAGLDAGRAAAKAGDTARAMQFYDACSKEIARIQTAARTEKAAAEIPEGLVARMAGAIELAQSRWQTERMRSIDGLSALTARLKSEDDPQLRDIAATIDRLINDIPDALNAALDGVARALEAGNLDAAVQATDQVNTEIDAGTAFLKDNLAALGNCEVNPFDIPVDIIGPVGDALKTVRSSVATIRR
ncbi:hypothetical protein ACFMPD_02100 [Sedimentitalea sp. HM32M-2]|uniref:hypothetical protein n=1 Tax=Sedimentitalea sp. HM32M-2 TaxID=3351566 RepID=UPI00363BF7BD